MPSDILKIFPAKKTNDAWISPNDLDKTNIGEYATIIITLENIFKSYIDNISINTNELNQYKDIISSKYNVNTNVPGDFIIFSLL